MQNSEHKFSIVDTTLRDGEQAPGVAFSADEKKEIALALDAAGIEWIEAGIPIMGGCEQEALRALTCLPLRAKLIAWNRALIKDIQASLDCGFSYIHISLPISDLHLTHKLRIDRATLLKQLADASEFVRSNGCSLIIGAEDASRADPEFFLRYADVAARFHALRIRFADTVGCMDPFTAFERISHLVARCPLPIEFHGHNDFGLATANTIAAFRAGAQFCSVTSTGIGERAGNASLEEVVAAFEHVFKMKTDFDVAALSSLAEKVCAASHRDAEQHILSV